MARNSTERLGGKYDLELRRSAFACTPEQESTQLSQTSTNKCGIVLVLREVVFFARPFIRRTSTTVLDI